MKKLLGVFNIFILLSSLFIFAPQTKAAWVGTQTVTFALSPTVGTYNIGDTFTLAININTGSNNVIVAEAIVNWNSNNLELTAWSTTNSVFNSGNICTYNSKPCEIVDVSTPGKADITKAKPSPGVNTTNGTFATLTFKALTATSPSADNITFSFTSVGTSGDSDIIQDTDLVPDILTGVNNAKITVQQFNPPTAPSNLSASAASSSQINLTWTDNSNNETGFKIMRKTGASGTYALIATNAANTNSYNDTGLTANTTYYYKVIATNSAGDSAASNETSAITNQNLPASPTNLDYTIISTTEIDLKWTDNSNNETNFIIERSVGNNTGYSQLTELGPGATSYKDTTVISSQSYYYRVKAKNLAGNSAYSNEIGPITSNSLYPKAPTGLTVGTISSSALRLAWNDNSNNETGFKIERKSDSGSFSQIAITEANVKDYTNSGLNDGATYTYRVRATNSAGDSNYSNEASATTLKPPPSTQTPTITTCTESNWTSSDGACQSNGTLTRTWTKTGSCSGGVSHPATETKTCTYSSDKPYGDGTLIKLTDSPNIYVIEGGQKKLIPDAQTFNALGYSWTNIQIVSDNAFNAYQTGSPKTSTTVPPSGQYPNETLLRATGEQKVYVIINGQKCWIPDAYTFVNSGYKWDDIKTIDKSTLDQYPTGPNAQTKIPSCAANVRLIRVSGDSRVYAIIGDRKHWIPTADLFAACGYNWTSIETVSANERDKYPRVYLVRGSDDPKVYFITSFGSKKWIPNPDIFNAYDNKWEDILVVPMIEIEAYPDLKLIRIEGDAKIYLLENDQKRWIVSGAIFNAKGYKWEEVLVIKPVEANFYPTGANVE